MNEAIYDDLALERVVKEHFGLKVDISQVIVRQVPVSPTARATVFLTAKKQLFMFMHGHSRVLLGDVRKTVSRMGLKAELFLPPKGQSDYFDQVGRKKFQEVFPGRANPSNEDLVYYRTLAPYNPALVQIQEVKTGEIFQYDSDARGNWRVTARFAYRRIKTS